jgi:hypothetical protein
MAHTAPGSRSDPIPVALALLDQRWPIGSAIDDTPEPAP